MPDLNKLDFSQLTGRCDSHIRYCEAFSCLLHKDLSSPLQSLRQRAWREAGIDLRVASGFRDYHRQRVIWQAKADGERPVMDAQGREVLPLEGMAEADKCHSILRWSALPGASRHHWGCDVDIFDAAVMPEDYRLQLSPEEYSPQGLFSNLMAWLEVVLVEQDCPWRRPFDRDRGGVAVEPWHLSYQPLASLYESQFDLAVWVENIDNSDIALQASLLAQAEGLYQRYIAANHLKQELIGSP